MKRRWIITALLAFAAVVICVAPFIGSYPIPFSALWGKADDPIAIDILWKMRIPRTVMAFLAGAGLSACGMCFQALFRNPLATPYTLGVSSGASLGAAICIQQGWLFSALGVPSVTICAFLGAGATIAVVYILATRAPKGSTNATMLLAGVAISFFFSSLILLMQYVADFTRTLRMLRWVMGGIESVTDFRDVLTVFPFVAAGCLIAAYLANELNLLSLGEDFAASRGVSVRRSRQLIYFAVSLTVGAIVSFCGPIGFVGMMTPHVCRLTLGFDHRRLLPASCLLGGAFLVVCDAFGRTIIAPAELPLGIITALAGGPFVLWLLYSRRNDFNDLY